MEAGSLMGEGIEADARILTIAKVCHQANKAICEAYGDSSQKDWNEADDWQKISCVKGVRFAVANPHLGPKEQHQAWLADKLMDGWLYGPEKDVERKFHPCALPYELLPDNQKIKDHVFRAIVKTLWW